ncbi:putative 5-formyltetrahydrofolate cyclo-ligase [Schizosaccharomyces pombe]|uniref:Probable 5-formyltetrahydrofolate cyclo-ligase n=1 Tax=Schizosaccharomyces pombe (strain 972 / ATCC 24843) TaxID=284812 RepID=FTHC_SCHPO|nr:putative 5-formyltetrahydrofolate cyclo-ligase [Schizosaccharomyces pombe]Q9P7W2.1 RecName: Full=Probable 5-formyltetrahydrofolate cyclo-ligase; AltName: Full=5,10-methenyl-tetrahydrofolate synthetase; Short=MTHFS; Short=Methenyl-THF synthetase [Schizosaccharomyces pombe 972h-]CAB66452.1 5-formyltetrahydrofolate cyclo-ligase (predicted) [Schizosaccharomyces pombe]|eukprot:NP_596203.1 putative 5-formyltetrahydrofolate cyclo-ligase [Schizosaccharomyces pombe]
MSLKKNQLRAILNSSLGKLADHIIDSQSISICKQVVELPEWKRCKNVCLYMNMPKKEVRTRCLIDVAFKEGKNVFIPKCIGSHVMEMYQVFEKTESLTINKWGIAEPNGESRKIMDDETDCELIIVPGVAFDEKLSRLGHGKGYYDNYISKYQSWALQKESRANMFKVGICLKEQILPNREIPMDTRDQKLDALVTPEKVIRNI